MTIDIFITILLWLPGLTALTMGILDVREERNFIDNARETTGKIVGTVGAKYRTNTQYGVDMGGTAMSMAGMNNNQFATGEQLGGAFLIVEYEVKNGDVYQIRSRQAFNTVPEKGVTVHYNREKPGDAIINRFYNSNAKYYQIVGGIAFLLLPIIIQYFN